MELINKKTLSIKNGTERSRQRQYISVKDTFIYFTAAIVRECGLVPGEYIHFMNEGEKWQFYTNDDTDGFLLTPVRAKGGINVTSSALCSLIKKTTGYTTDKNYKVVKTNQEHDRCPVFEIIPL